jgi:hypothetical protein
MSKDQASGGQKGSQSNYKKNYQLIDWSVGREDRIAASEAAKAKADARAPIRSHKGFEEFVSPVDKTIISDRGQLREHNKRNGCTNISDYGPDYHARRGKEMHQQRQGKNDKQERYQAIRKSMHKYGLE